MSSSCTIQRLLCKQFRQFCSIRRGSTPEVPPRMEGEPKNGQTSREPDGSKSTDYAIDTDYSRDRCDDNAATRVRAVDEELTCSLYISRASNHGHCNQGSELSRASLEEAIRAADPSAGWHVSETSCGLIAAFARETDAERLLQRGDLARVFEGPVQVCRALSSRTRTISRFWSVVTQFTPPCSAYFRHRKARSWVNALLHRRWLVFPPEIHGIARPYCCGTCLGRFLFKIWVPLSQSRT